MKLKGAVEVSPTQIAFGKKLGLVLDGKSVGVAAAMIAELARVSWGYYHVSVPPNYYYRNCEVLSEGCF